MPLLFILWINRGAQQTMKVKKQMEYERKVHRLAFFDTDMEM